MCTNDRVSKVERGRRDALRAAAWAAAQAWSRPRTPRKMGSSREVSSLAASGLITVELKSVARGSEAAHLLVVERGYATEGIGRPRARSGLSKLTERERQVALLITNGHTNAQIAATLDIGLIIGP